MTSLNELSKPVQGLELAGWQFKSVNGDWLGILDELGKNQAVHEGCEVREVYAMTDSPNDRDEVREAHTEWSRSTFGNVGPIGPLKHLSKEALEAAAKPDDLSEWADMQFLLWDAQRRAGITDEQITQAMIEKLKVNMARQWPEPKDGEPRLHITAPPAPAVPEEAKLGEMPFLGKNERGYVRGWNDCRAAMLAQPVSSGYKLNYPEIPDGWISCEERMPEEGDVVLVCQEGGIIFCAEVDDREFYPDEFPRVPTQGREITHWMPLPEPPNRKQNSDK